MAGASKPDRIALEKGLQAWASRSWFLDEVHLDSAEKRADGSRGLPKTWRLGFQPNLKQMHDDARINRVGKTAVDDMLLDEIKAAKWLDAGASTLGAKVHKLPTGPEQVPGDGEFRYVILGPGGQSESGKPSALATRFCEEVTGPQNPRAAKNAIVVAVPDRAGLSQAQEKVKDYLAWLEVKSQLSGQPVDPVRSSMLDSAVTSSRKDIADALRQAYCIVVTRAADDSVQAFKVTVDPSKPLFTTIKEDPKSRITDVALAPDALLPGSGSGFDLWREDEDRRRVKTIVGAFAERPKLPKMLRRKDLLDTVSNGCEQGLYVLSLPRPDGSARTWWRAQIDEVSADRRCTRSGAEFRRSTGRTCPSPFGAWQAGWTGLEKRREGRRSCFLLRWVRSDHRPSRGRLDGAASDPALPGSQGAGSSCRRRQVGPCVVDQRNGINLGRHAARRHRVEDRSVAGPPTADRRLIHDAGGSAGCLERQQGNGAFHRASSGLSA